MQGWFIVADVNCDELLSRAMGSIEKNGRLFGLDKSDKEILIDYREYCRKNKGGGVSAPNKDELNKECVCLEGFNVIADVRITIRNTLVVAIPSAFFGNHIKTKWDSGVLFNWYFKLIYGCDLAPALINIYSKINIEMESEDSLSYEISKIKKVIGGNVFDLFANTGVFIKVKSVELITAARNCIE